MPAACADGSETTPGPRSLTNHVAPVKTSKAIFMINVPKGMTPNSSRSQPLDCMQSPRKKRVYSIESKADRPRYSVSWVSQAKTNNEMTGAAMASQTKRRHFSSRQSKAVKTQNISTSQKKCSKVKCRKWPVHRVCQCPAARLSRVRLNIVFKVGSVAPADRCDGCWDWTILRTG